jgi:transcriptional regulator with PAS, ATPase and Fis domain
MFSKIPHVLVALSLGALGTLIGFGSLHLFPKVERQFSDWQIIRLSREVDERNTPPIVVLTAPSGRSRICGEGRWHPEQVEMMLGVLSQAGASVVGLLDDFSSGGSADCGDLGSLARLAETTVRVGKVIYPDSAPAMLRNAAAGLGRLYPIPDEDGIVRSVKGFFGNPPGSAWPIGVVLGAWPKPPAAAVEPVNAPLRDLYVPYPIAPFFQERSFETVRALSQEGQTEDLQAMFKGSLVILSGAGSPEGKVTTLWGEDSDSAAAHAWMAKVVLTGAWLRDIPLAWAMLACWVLGSFVVGLLLEDRHRYYKVSLAVGLVLVCGGGIWLVTGKGGLWPLGATALSLSLCAGTSLGWRALMARRTVHRRIREGQETLRQLQEDLVRKQQTVRELEGRLEEARSQTKESASVITHLYDSQDGILEQLQESERAMAGTQVRIDQMQQELEELRRRVPAESPMPEALEGPHWESMVQECALFQILTRDRPLLEIFYNLKKAAQTSSPILLLGETGTGKEVFARAAHALSPRRTGPFISVNMAAIRPELFEGELFGHVKGAFTGAVGREGLLRAAHGGTIFLDEVGELPPDVQAKMLRVLEDGSFYRVGDSRMTKVDVRIVAATNRCLLKEIEGGRYREDLYYRLRSIELTLPPLRERCREDRMLLANTFLAEVAGEQNRPEMRFSQDALDMILAYRWPGNIRELRHTIAQAVALTDGSLIDKTNLRLPATVRGDKLIGRAHGKEDLERMEDLMVLKCLRRHHFDMQATARELGWDRSTVTQRLKGLGFQALVEHGEDFQAAARALAGDDDLLRVVEGRLREYTKNLLPPSKQYRSAEEAIADCRKRFRNLPERHYPAVEQLIRARFSVSDVSRPARISVPPN